ncbi:hypothetical protein MXB_1780, partial [Myxobolus squamalis]
MDDIKRVIMVTGGSGLVGKNLERLVNHENLSNENFIFLTSKDANLQNPEDVRQLFEKIKPDVVIHLAANQSVFLRVKVLEDKIALEVLGSGKPLRQFIFAPDLAKLILKVMREYDSPSPIILCTDESDEISIGDVAEHIRKGFEIKDKLIFNPSFADGQFKKTASNKKLRTLWPDFKFTSFAEGLY